MIPALTVALSTAAQVPASSAGNDRLVLLLAGVLAMGYLTAAIFFLRFWRQSRERLFVLFALAFTLLGVQRIALSLASSGDGETIQYYVLRLVAYLIILGAILDRNRQARDIG